MSDEELKELGFAASKCYCPGRPITYKRGNIKIKIYWSKREPVYLLFIDKFQEDTGFAKELKEKLIAHGIINPE